MAGEPANHDYTNFSMKNCAEGDEGTIWGSLTLDLESSYFYVTRGLKSLTKSPFTRLSPLPQILSAGRALVSLDFCEETSQRFGSHEQFLSMREP